MQMFFKLLPTLTKTKLDQAKIIFKSDHEQMGMTIVPNEFEDIKQEPAYDVDAPFINTQDTYDNTQELSHDNQSYDIERNQCIELRVQDDTETNEENIAEEVMQYLQQLQEQGVDNKNVKVIYVQNGQIVGITDDNDKQENDSNLDESNEQKVSNIDDNSEQERDKDSNCTQYENVSVEKFKSEETIVVEIQRI